MGLHFVFVIDRIGSGGAGGTCLRLSRALRRRGHVAQIVSIKPGVSHALQPDDDVHVLTNYTWLRAASFARRWLECRALVRKLKELAPGGQIDRLDGIIGFIRNAHKALHQSGLDQGNIHYSVRLSLNGQLALARSRGRWRQYWVRRRLHRVFHDKSLILCAEAIRDELQQLGIRPRRAVTIYNPFDFEAIRARAAEAAAIPDGDYIVHMGRDGPQKRHDILLRAFARVSTPIKLVLLGRHSDRIPQMVHELGLDDRVVLAGFQPNPYPWIHHAKLLVSSSDSEGISNSLIEALICGTTAVSTDCPTGPAEVLTGDLARYLVPVGDVAALAAKIDEALANPPDVTGARILDLVGEDSICNQYCAAVTSADKP